MSDLETLLKSIENVKVIDSSIDYTDYVSLDLSVSNIEFQEKKIQNSITFEEFIENYLKQNHSKVAFGGYNEERNLYKRSSIFNSNQVEERNIHIGIDLWIESGTKILAALNGFIHSFKYNEGLGNYGFTIILQHEIESQIFYTLYGHLSKKSIENIEISTLIEKGQLLATLGNSSENGDYAPHLHFQIIKDIENYFGDYPGVCSKNSLNYYLKNCPDPNLLLKIY
jgi:murein DD-endopeptidase MepM/ murein hydrolase activator NlpD